MMNASVPRSVSLVVGALLGVLASCSCATSNATARGSELEERLRARGPHAGPVLFVVTTAGEQTLANGKKRATGVFLGELYDAYVAVTAAGFEVTFATPDGRPPVVDPESLDESYWEQPEGRKQALALVETDAFKAPLPLQEALAREQHFAALVVPGGQGVMVDLLEDATLHELLARFGASGRPVGLICHAPALLLRLPAETDPFRGRAVTSVSGLEELFIETFIMSGEAKERAIGAALKERGYAYESGLPKASFAVRDGNLVTSQNPYSGDAFRLRFLEALDAYVRETRAPAE